MSMCRVFSCVVGRGCLLWPVHSVGKTLLAFALLHFDSRTKLASYSSYLLTSYFCIPAPYGEKDIFFLVLVLEGLIGLHRTSQLSFFGISSWSIDLDYCDVEWFALEMNWDHSVIFEIAPKYCISDSFVDHEGDSISSKLILKEISPEYSLEGLMLKLKLQHFGRVMHRATHWKRPWFWERLKAKGEEGGRGWDS